MAIYSVNLSEVKRSSGENAIASAAYISGSKLALKPFDFFTGEYGNAVKTWDFRNKGGVAYSIILAPDGAPAWVFDREELWNRAEGFEFDLKSQTARRLMVALPRELTQEQNVELAREFALEYLVNHGMVVDLNIHYDNEHNPHMHLQITTRELVNDSVNDPNGTIGAMRFAPTKQRKWGKVLFINYLRSGVATVINKHLELHGHLDRVSHLSHKARGIELTPGIHEGVARHMSIQERRELNEMILLKNAAAIRNDPELVFQKLSVNKPVFSKEDIAKVLSEALYRDMEIELEGNGNGDAESLSTRYANEFMVAYERLLKSSEVRLVNPCDLRGRTLYALTKRLELEERFAGTVEELDSDSKYSIGISPADIGRQSVVEAIGAKVRSVTQMIGLLVEASPHAFTEEQRAAIVSIVNGSDISLLEGFPGSGKTSTMREIVRQYRKAGYRVVGTATGSNAAEVLGIEGGIEAKNISRLRREWQLVKHNEADPGSKYEFELVLRADYYKEEQYCKFGASLTNKDVLIIDEASMVELSSMDYLLSEVKAAGAKAILVGDNNQLAAIGMTGAFKKASQIVGSSKLTSVMRHKSQDDNVTLKYREATSLLGQYKINKALDVYDQLGVFSVHKTEEDTKLALVKDYINGYIELAKNLSQDNLSATKSLVIGTYTNIAANYFNNEVRHQLKQAGILKGRPTIFRTGNETIELVKGEQIVFLENKPKFMQYYGVLNGEVGTVLDFTEYPDEFGHGTFTALVHKADGSKRVVTISTRGSVVNSKGDGQNNLFSIPSARFKYGYAVTGSKLQGDTATRMMVYYELLMGYEAFNVLMTRHRESVRLYAAEDLLESAIYSRLGSNKGAVIGNDESEIKQLRADYSIESYRTLSDIPKEPIAPWRIGLAMSISRRVDNSFAFDYEAKDLLTPNETTIKEYLEAREAAFALRAKLGKWRMRESRPLTLARLHKALYKSSEHYRNKCEEATEKLNKHSSQDSNSKSYQTKTAAILLKAHHINPYSIFVAVKLIPNEIKADKAALKEFISKTSNIDLLIWANLSNLAKEELEATVEKLQEELEKRKATARLICDNYHGSIIPKSKPENNSITKDLLTMGDRLKQLGMNYEPIERHAGYSPYEYYLKSNKTAHGLFTHKTFGALLLNLSSIASGTDNHYQQIIANLTKDSETIGEYIEDLRLKLLQSEEKLSSLTQEQKSVTDEIAKHSTNIQKLFPEYLSRIYKDDPNKVIVRWNKLKQVYGSNESDKLTVANAAFAVYNNPKLLGNLKGIGFGSILGLTEERQKAIARLETVSKHFKEYEAAKDKLAELEAYKTSSEYATKEKERKGLQSHIGLLKDLLPSIEESNFLNALSETLSGRVLGQEEQSGHNHSRIYEALQSLSREEDTQNLIYEYYNHIGREYEYKATTELLKENESEERVVTVESERQNQKVSKVTKSSKASNAPIQTKTPALPRITFEQVNAHLTQTHFEQIFNEFAPQINEDAPKITRSGDWINCGSLGMNLKNGIWKRLSTNESGNIYSFVALARNCNKTKALEFMAAITGFYNEHEHKQNKYEHQKEATNREVAKLDKEPKNKWVAYSVVPQEARAMNPKADFSWMMKENDITNIHQYKNSSGELIGGTMRLINGTTKEKQVLPYAYCRNRSTNQSAWRFKGFTDHGYKPIYKIENLNQDKRTILIVEGEKTADAAQKLFPEYAVMSWLGGSSSVDKVNWGQLKNRSIVIWPDNDIPGKTAALKILNHINVANDKIGYASIVDLTSVNKDGDRDHGQVHNPLPEKWDLADELPAGVTIDDIKHVIEEAREQSRNPLNLKLRNKALESNREHVSVPEFLNQYKYLEAKGIISSSHEFLKPEHGLYRDTLACLIPQARQSSEYQAEQITEREFIIASENKYEALISNYNLSATSYLEHYDSIHQSHEKLLEDKGIDRVDLYKTMVRDVTLLHSLELDNKANANLGLDANTDKLPKLTKSHHNAIAKEAYDAIQNYTRPFSKRMQSNSLTTQEKIKIAETIYTNTTTPDFRKSLAESQNIENSISSGLLHYHVGLAFDRIVHVDIQRQIDQSKPLTVFAENVDTLRQMAFDKASEIWLINNKQALSDTEYELCVHRAVFELNASKVLDQSSDLNFAQIAGQPIQNNPYNEILASIISHQEITIDNHGKITKPNYMLGTVIGKRDLALKANQLFEKRSARIKEIQNDRDNTLLHTKDNHLLLTKTSNKTKTEEEQLTNRILREHLTDHEMIHDKSNITTERFTAMHEIARHEMHLHQSIQQEWHKYEHKTQVATKGLSSEQSTSDIDTSIAIARHRMRREMHKIETHNIHDQSHHPNHQNYTIYEIHKHHHEQSLNKIAGQHHAHIDNHIAEVKQLQRTQAQNQRDQEAQRQHNVELCR